MDFKETLKNFKPKQSLLEYQIMVGKDEDRQIMMDRLMKQQSNKIEEKKQRKDIQLQA
jgi:hypothetical protein